MRNAEHLTKAIANGGENYSDEYYTPSWVWEPLGGFDLDPCAGPQSEIAAANWRDHRALTTPWHGRVWLNPPYSRDAKRLFMERLARHGQGTALVPASTDTAWFQAAIAKASAVLFIKGRVDFIRPGGKRSANAGGSALIAYGEADAKALKSAWESGSIKGMFFPVNNR